MAIGYWIVKGDKTSCGGLVHEGMPERQFAGNPVAVNGSKVSCGKHSGMYSVGGAHPGESIHGHYVASTLYSRSTCPCKAFFIPSQTWASHGPYQGNVAKAAPVASSTVAEPEQHAQAAKKPAQDVPTQQDSKPHQSEREPVDAGFCVLPYGSVTESYEPWLFNKEPPAGTRELYRSLNGSGNEFKAGSIMLLVDPDKQNSMQIAHMQAAKERIDAALAPLSHEEANFLHQHYATIANFSSFADKGIGLAADPVGKYFENIQKILSEIQDTYKNAYLTRGALIGEQFYVRRSQLFKELNTVLKVGFLNKGMKFGEYAKIKDALGLSSKSITHEWNKTGINNIDGYATHIERAAKYVKLMKYAGYVGIGFSAFHSINEVNEACSVGREDECSKKKYTETGSFTGSIAGGLAGGAIGMGVCTVALGAATMAAGGAGVLACGVILGGAGGYVGSETVSSFGEYFGDVIYETIGK